MSDIEEIKKMTCDSDYLSKSEMDKINKFVTSQQQTIDNLTKEIDELRAEKIEYKEEVFQMLMDEDLEMLAERL